MSLSFVPLVTALLPLAAIHACYLIAAHLGHVPWCIPYLDNCVHISATGREGPEAHVFRATIIPTAVLVMLYWRLGYEWLRALGSRARRTNRTMLGLGLSAGLGLVVYASVLGAIEDIYSLQRRIGVTLFYGATFLAQVLMAGQIAALRRRRPGVVPAAVVRVLAAICIAVAALGAVSLASWILGLGHDRLDEPLAWTLALLVLLYPLGTHFGWKATGFRASFGIAGG